MKSTEWAMVSRRRSDCRSSCSTFSLFHFLILYQNSWSIFENHWKYRWGLEVESKNNIFPLVTWFVVFWIAYLSANLSPTQNGLFAKSNIFKHLPPPRWQIAHSIELVKVLWSMQPVRMASASDANHLHETHVPWCGDHYVDLLDEKLIWMSDGADIHTTMAN